VEVAGREVGAAGGVVPGAPNRRWQYG
jgi:hypothetical protein